MSDATTPQPAAAPTTPAAAPAAAPATPQQSTPAPTNLYQACTHCTRPRVLCIRVRRRQGWSPMDQGHANLTVHEQGVAPITYGNWGGTGPGNTSIRRNAPGDDYNADPRYRPRDVRCREMTPEQERELERALNQRQEYSLTNNNCASWAGTTWNNTMGENLNFGSSVYHPGTLGDSINAAGMGVTPP